MSCFGSNTSRIFSVSRVKPERHEVTYQILQDPAMSVLHPFLSSPDLLCSSQDDLFTFSLGPFYLLFVLSGTEQFIWHPEICKPCSFLFIASLFRYHLLKQLFSSLPQIQMNKLRKPPFLSTLLFFYPNLTFSVQLLTMWYTLHVLFVCHLLRVSCGSSPLVAYVQILIPMIIIAVRT